MSSPRTLVRSPVIPEVVPSEISPQNSFHLKSIAVTQLCLKNLNLWTLPPPWVNVWFGRWMGGLMGGFNH